MTYTLVTGACGGLGGAFVRLLAERGEPLFLTGRSAERLQRLENELHEAFPALPVRTFECDLASEASRAALFTRFDEEQITFNRLVYVAGADVQKAFEKYDESKLVMQTRVNFEGAVSLTRAVMARSALDGSTEFLAVGSMSGNCPMPYFALYSATKKALWQFYAALRTELKGRAKVTCVQPGSIPTREDIRKSIREHGFWTRVSAVSPQRVARASLKAVKRNKRKKTIGFWNRVIGFFTAIAPMSLKMRFVARRWKKTEKDAF
ncbi:MAG: SDR family NAD(P)-dependent oxidoreductase [Clostridia bacterium]|nr:SDR family NAD(P)-dependent oxidoreductase [Clostridia bacterium]